MGSKGSQTVSQNQTYTPNAATLSAGTQALSMAQNAASQPFQLPVAPVAGFSPDQLSAFQATNNAQGMAQPYFQQGANYINQSAQMPNVSAFYNPMAQNVTNQLQNIFGQQMSQTTGQLQQAAGGVGADRIAVGQGNLANQQGLAAGQTYAGLYQNALQAAQQQQQAQAGAGYGLANIGAGAQNAQLQGIQAQLGTGGLQQQLSQAQLNAPYQNQLAQLAYPFQTAQYLAGITGGVGGVLGGTTNGQTTYPAPSLFSQILGLGTAGVGLAGQAGAFGGGSGGTGTAGGTDYAYNSPQAGLGNFSPTYMPGYGYYPQAAKDGGRIERAEGGVTGEAPFFATPSYVPSIQMQPSQAHIPQLPQIKQPAQSNPMGDIASMAKMAAAFMAGGGAVNPQQPYAAYADGGDIMSFMDRAAPAEEGIASGVMRPQGMNYTNYLPMNMDDQAYPKGGFQGTPRSPTEPPASFADRSQVIQDAIANGTMDPVGSNYTAFNQSAPASPSSPATQPTMSPTEVVDADALPPNATATSGPGGGGGAPPPMGGGSRAMAFNEPYPMATKQDAGQDFIKSPWAALTRAGFGMMAGTSPFAGVNIGHGALEGMKQLEEQRKEGRSDEEVNLRARQLMQQAKFHEDQYNRLTAAQQLESLKPFKYMVDPQTGLDRYAIRDPKTGQLIDVQSHKPVDATTMTGAPGNAGAAPEAPKFAQPPPPLGIPELGVDLQPTKVNAPVMMKGPFANANARQIQATDAQMVKERPSLEVQRDQITRLKNDYAILMHDDGKDGFFTKIMTMPGADPEARVGAMRTANLAATSANKPPPFSPEKIAAMEEAIKIQKTMGMSFASTISPRDAMQMQLASISAQPGLTQSPQGMLRLIGLYDGLNNNKVAEHDYWNRWRMTNPFNATGWDSEFRQKNPTEKFMVGAMLENLPNQKAKSVLPDAIKELRAHPSDPQTVMKFNKIYNNTASFFLTGKFDPFAPMAQ